MRANRYPKRTYPLIAAATVLALLSAMAPAGAAAATAPYIVGVDVRVDPAVAAARVGVIPALVLTEVFHGYVADLTRTQLTRVRKDPATLSIEEETTSPVTFPKATVDPPQPAQSVRNPVRRVGGLGSPTARIDGIDERVNVDVAIIDSGIDADHPDLNVAGGVNCVGNRGGFADTDSHGTMVAGLVGAIDNAIGVVGVAPGARVWAVRVTSGNGGQITDRRLLCGLEWVAANAHIIDVANMSLRGVTKLESDTCESPNRKAAALHQAVCRLVELGVVVVVAAGNDTSDVAGVVPARFPEVITVSAISDSDGMPGGLGGAPVCLPGENDDTFATFSNFGLEVDVAAPGSCITSTHPDGLYAFNSGTSFATPLVSGAAALYLATHPDGTPAEVRMAIINAAEPGPIPGDPDPYPEGILNVNGF